MGIGYREPGAIRSIIDQMKRFGYTVDYRSATAGRPDASYAALSAIEQRWGSHPLVTGIFPTRAPPGVTPGPMATAVTQADAAGLQQLLRQGARGITASDAQLLEWQLLDRLRLNPSDDFARIMLGKVKRTAKRKIVKTAVKKAAAKLASYVIPGAGVIATAADVVGLVGPVIVKSQKESIDRLVSRMTNNPGSQTPPEPRPRASKQPTPQPKRQLDVPTLQLPTQTTTRDRPILADPGKISVPEPSVQVTARPIDLGPNPLVEQATAPAKQPGQRPRPSPVPWSSVTAPGQRRGVRFQPGQRTRSKPGRARPAAGRKRAGSSPGELLRRFAEQQTRPLTATQSDRGQSDNDKCKCQTEKKQRKKRKPRSICYRGTFTERANGLTKRKMEKVPCQ